MTGICTVDIKCNMELLSVAFNPSTTYLPWTGTLRPWSIIILKACKNIGNEFNAVAHL